MTLSTSDVAVCWSSDSVRSSVRWRNSLSSRAFSIAMTAWSAKFCTSATCFSEKGRTSWRYHNHANQLISPDHRHSYHAPRTAKFAQLRACTSWRCSIVRLVLHIGDLTCPLRRHRPSQESGTSGIDDRMALPLFSERKWRTMQRDGTKTIAFPKVERAEFRLTDARGILQHGLEDWL